MSICYSLSLALCASGWIHELDYKYSPNREFIRLPKILKQARIKSEGGLEVRSASALDLFVSRYKKEGGVSLDHLPVLRTNCQLENKPPSHDDHTWITAEYRTRI